MTQADQDAVIGRIVRERAETERNISALESEAGRLGAMYRVIGDILATRPEALVFENVPRPVEYSQGASHIFNAKDIDGNRLVSLTSELRELKSTLDRLREEAAKFGL